MSLVLNTYICCFSLAGCPEAAVSNIYNAVQAAVSSGAVGVVVSHWSGIGHVTHYPMSLTGIITAAGLSWNSQISLVNALKRSFFINKKTAIKAFYVERDDWITSKYF